MAADECTGIAMRWRTAGTKRQLDAIACGLMALNMPLT
jgi:hypothetical protein